MIINTDENKKCILWCQSNSFPVEFRKIRRGDKRCCLLRCGMSDSSGVVISQSTQSGRSVFLCSPLGMIGRAEMATLPMGAVPARKATSHGLSSDPFSALCLSLVIFRVWWTALEKARHLCTGLCPINSHWPPTMCQTMLGLRGIYSLEKERDVNQIILLLNIEL